MSTISNQDLGPFTYHWKISKCCKLRTWDQLCLSFGIITLRTYFIQFISSIKLHEIVKYILFHFSNVNSTHNFKSGSPLNPFRFPGTDCHPKKFSLPDFHFLWITLPIVFLNTQVIEEHETCLKFYSDACLNAEKILSHLVFSESRMHVQPLLPLEDEREGIMVSIFRLPKTNLKPSRWSMRIYYSYSPNCWFKRSVHVTELKKLDVHLIFPMGDCNMRWWRIHPKYTSN